MSPIRMSRLESAIHVVLEFNEAFNRHDVAGMMQLMSDDCVFENTAPAPDGSVYAGKAAVTQFWQDFFRASPQAHVAIEEIFWRGSPVHHALALRLGRVEITVVGNRRTANAYC